jgi:hypothetical protein
MLFVICSCAYRTRRYMVTSLYDCPRYSLKYHICNKIPIPGIAVEMSFDAL